jgi:hypothetical protein
MALKRGLRRKVSAHVVLLIVDEAIEERSGQVNFGCLYNAKGSRRVFLAVLATIFALTALADAAGTPDRYCLQGSQSDYPGNCQFNSYFQCMNAASGKSTHPA